MTTQKLNFLEEDGEFVAEFVAKSDFNIHLEREEDGDIVIQQRTAGTQFDATEHFIQKDNIFDFDFTGFVFPKTIRVISYTKVIEGYVSFN